MNHLFQHARTLLFLPADRLARLPKALGSDAHAVILDLEDGVAEQSRDAAREAIREAWPTIDAGVRERLAIRINAGATPWHDADMDLAHALAADGLGGVMVPKVESVASLRAIHERLGGAAATAALLPLIESAEGHAALDLIARVPGVARLVFGHLDFQADLGMQCGVDERELDSVRFDLVMASRRAGLAAPLDGVTADLDNDKRLSADAERARRFGFGGKLCIHPRQVKAVHAAFAPGAAEIEWATRVLEASRAHGGGAFRHEGGMVDAPVLHRARRILELAGVRVRG